METKYYFKSETEMCEEISGNIDTVYRLMKSSKRMGLHGTISIVDWRGHKIVLERW